MNQQSTTPAHPRHSRFTRIRPLAAALLLTAAAVGAKDGAIQCANLIYGGTHTSRCFSDEFLSAVQRDTTVATERRFRSVKLASDELFTFPFVVMTGESDFHLTSSERKNLQTYLARGGFLLASAGCSNEAWDRAFRREMRTAFPDQKLERLAGDHPLFRVVHEIGELKMSKGSGEAHLEGLMLDGRLVAVYSKEGLNDTAHTEGCCCCGGNEIQNSLAVNVNILVYALLH